MPIMIVRSLVVSSILVGLVGCSSHDVTISDGSGTKVSVNTDSGNLISTDKNGDTTKVTTQQDGSTSVQTKEGNASVGGRTSVSEAELEVPFYPGSTEKPASNMKFEGKDEKTYSTTRETNDTLDQVAEFYKGKVKGMATTTTTEIASGSATLPSGAVFGFVASKKDGKTEIMLTTNIKLKK